MAKQYDLWGNAINLEPTEQKVQRILEETPAARGDDKFLLLEVWKEDGLVDVLGDDGLLDRFCQWFVTQASSPESVVRMRRKLQSAGRCLPSPEVQERRAALQEQWREFFRRN